mgnify:CR=1 FL=1
MFYVDTKKLPGKKEISFDTKKMLVKWYPLNIEVKVSVREINDQDVDKLGGNLEFVVFLCNRKETLIFSKGMLMHYSYFREKIKENSDYAKLLCIIVNSILGNNDYIEELLKELRLC